jgi:prepilin-type processing-associated H-X9-DG protein
MLAGFSRADVVAVVSVLGVLLLTSSALWPAYQRERRHAIRHRCGTNLSEIGKALIAYANDHDGALPVAGGKGTVWGAGLNDWKAGRREDAFGLDANAVGGEATVSASLFLLVRAGRVSPELFVCPRDKGTTAFQPEKYGIVAAGLNALWDFGPDPARHCSYAYHMPYGPYRLTTSSEPGMAVAADRNPWIDGPRQKAGQFSLFKPDIAPFNGTSEEARRGNSQVHRTKVYHQDGQNVLYLDGHVEFARRASCGFEDDNAYTFWDGSDNVRGLPPKPYASQPANKFDSLLVNDPPLGR